MATRSNIGIINPDGSVEVIYCHFDGYLSHVGKILLESYKKLSKIRKLISLGDISFLDHNIGKKTDFDNPTDGQVIAYGRDRGDPDTAAQKYGTMTEYLFEVGYDIEFIYLFDMIENKWKYTTTNNTNRTWFELGSNLKFKGNKMSYKEYTVKVYDDGSKFWSLNGKLHREDGPAIEWADGSKFWFLNGKYHREDGPAVEWVNGSKFWYLNGKEYTEAGFKKKTAPIKELTVAELEKLLGYPVKIVKE
jgi:hypothetical protein